MKYGTTTVALAALVVAAACSGDLNQPVSPDGISSANSESFARSGPLHTQKDCTNYYGRVGDTCTITKSNLSEIEVGSVIRYLVAANLETLTYDGPVVLDPPGPGNNAAAGHCTVNLAAGTGVCAFSGGTGKFAFFNASVDVTPVGGVIYAWDGTYSYGR
jgi:hypothetical protein